MSYVTCTNGYIGEAVTIRMAKAVNSYTSYTLEYAFGDTNGTIATKTNATTVSWTLPLDFYYQLPNSDSGTAQILWTMYDINNAVLDSGYTEFTVMVPNNTTSRPTFTVTFTEKDPKVNAIGARAIKYVSDVGYTINATGYKGASIVSYRVESGQDVLTTSTGTFYNVSSDSYRVIVTDSRGISNARVFTYALNDYVRLSCNMWLEAIDPEEGTITLGIDGNYHNGNFYAVNTNNTLTVRVDLVDRENVTVSKTATTTISGNKYTGTVTFTGIDYRAVYEATAFANDRLTDTQSKTVLCVGKPVFDWSNEDFRFNVPISSIDGYNFADFVIETGETAMGSNGTWYWRKWKSGRAECTGCRNFGKYGITTVTTSNYKTWGRGSILTQTFPSGLFVDTPEVIDMRLVAAGTASSPAPYTGYVGIVGADEAEGATVTLPSNTDTGSFTIYYPGVYQPISYPATYVSFNVIGRWK